LHSAVAPPWSSTVVGAGTTECGALVVGGAVVTVERVAGALVARGATCAFAFGYVRAVSPPYFWYAATQSDRMAFCALAMRRWSVQTRACSLFSS
jgi:hypothetical protein